MKNPAEHQAAFDAIVTELLRQGERSASDGVLCKYRIHESDRTLKCVVGWLIPDDQYDEDMEAQCLEIIQRNVPALRDLELDFLLDMQKVHDEERPYRWAEGFRYVALIYEIDPSVIDTIETA